MVDCFLLKRKALIQDSMKVLWKIKAKIRDNQNDNMRTTMFKQYSLQLTFSDILRITNNFSKSNVIGDGGSGTVYKGILPNGQAIAIKRLGKAKDQGSKELLSEMQALGKVKHENLIPLLGSCSFGEEKVLIYEYMENGSLEYWLRKKTRALKVLDWEKSLKIAIGTARWLSFLHHSVVPPAIHRDVKSNNILLDHHFEPRLADFGLARVVSLCETHVTTEIARTFGYIAPEYSQSWRSTTKGDVYSFGGIMLGIVTGKEPTGLEFKDVEGGNLVGWVREMAGKEKEVECMNGDFSDESREVVQKLELLHLGLQCTSEDPMKRPSMQEVVKSLEYIATNY